MDTSDIERAILDTTVASRGHFLYESGHHGDLWLDLDRLLIDTRRLRDWVAALAEQTASCQPEIVCGPLTGGAFIAQMMAAELGAGFVFAERFVAKTGAVQYHTQGSQREILSGRRVLLVDDVINAGSALRSTLQDLSACGIKLTGLASLLTLGEAASQIAKHHSVPLFTLTSLKRGMWSPQECPLCRSEIPLINHLVRSPSA